MGKDLIDDRYGRFREIPLDLMRQGHEVRGVCFSYRPRPTGQFEDGGLTWTSINLGRFALTGLVSYLRETKRIAQDFQPDIVVAASDAFHAIWGVKLARSCGAISVVDLYDNFESYAGTKLPFIYGAFRHSIRQADLVACISAPLERHICERYGREGPTIILGNGVRKDLFSPGDKRSARARLGLPEDAVIFGTAGALARSRDIETVFRAADLLAMNDSRIHLAVAGPRDEHLVWPKVAQVHDLGLLPHDQIPELINGLDVVVVPNRESAFGSFCHPQKAVEAAACGRPYVSARVGAMAELQDEVPESLYDVGDERSLANAVMALVEKPPPSQAVNSWSDLASKMLLELEEAQQMNAKVD